MQSSVFEFSPFGQVWLKKKHVFNENTQRSFRHRFEMTVHRPPLSKAVGANTPDGPTLNAPLLNTVIDPPLEIQRQNVDFLVLGWPQ